MSPPIAPSLPLPSPAIPPIGPGALAVDPAVVAPAPKNAAVSTANSTATWTAERIEQLRSCVGDGMTCSQIAAVIGVSRNAVIGKIHRLGLSSGRPPGAGGRTKCPPRARHPRGPAPPPPLAACLPPAPPPPRQSRR